MLTPSCLCLYAFASVLATSGFPKQVMVIYNGVHYDALALTAKPNASSWEDDITEFNPRTKRGNMILEAARTLVGWAAIVQGGEAGP